MKLPSKTFILGEYVVLEGGPGLILTTPPYFEITSRKITEPASSLSNPGIHPQSPAGIWIKKHADFFKHYQIDFHDPYQGKGGFGASSAQFLGIYNITNPIQNELSAVQSLLKPAQNLASLNRLLQAYWSTFPAETHPLPSGADLVAQLFGNVVYWHRNQQQIASYHWPFKDLAYCLIHTGQKKTTHENLSHIPKPPALKQMTHIVENGHTAFKSQNTSAFIEAIQAYAHCMQQENCVIPETQAIITALYQSNLIFAAKGCGTLGADVILILVDSIKINELVDWLKQRSITVATNPQKHQNR